MTESSFNSGFLLAAYQTLVDRSTPFILYRWLVVVALLALFMLRVVWLQGFYVVAYALGIYLLNLFLLFLSPRFDPALQEDEQGLGNEANIAGGNDVGLPMTADEEFRPFIRRLPEFRFWHSAFWASLVSLGCTFFSLFDIPVFWPILLLYFIMLFALTMRRQIQHMIRYKYVPFDLGKPTK